MSNQINHYIKSSGYTFLLFLIAGLLITACDEDDVGVDPDLDAPEVISTSPDDGATDVAVNTTITAAFSEEIDSTTLNESTFYVNFEDTLSVPGTIDYSANTVTYTPDADLEANTEYTVTLTSAIQDLDGNNLEENYQWVFTTGASASDTNFVVQEPIELGTAMPYAILSRNAITDSDTVNFSEIIGDVGISPGASTDISGFELKPDSTGEFSTAPNVDGRIYASDYEGATADNLLTTEEELIAAYEDSYDESRGAANTLSGDLNAITLTPGLYDAESIELSDDGVLVLDAEENEEAVFIIRSAAGINAGNNSEVMLSGGANPDNVYWVTDGDVNLGENSISTGNFITGGSVNMQAGSELNGRLLLQGENGDQINMNQSTIRVPETTDEGGGL